MDQLPAPVVYLLVSWGVITAVLVILVIYRSTLSTREDDQLYLNEAEASMMASEQQVIVAKLNRLGLPIIVLAILSGILLLASGGVWMWLGLRALS